MAEPTSVEELEDTTPAAIDEASVPFVGKWHTLVSTTNWEKGKIIGAWRKLKQDAGEETTQFSDEAWARMVGDVTSQHVGRLRRVFDRFGGVFTEYAGLYWSHFHAALDWDDAEIWLEGALQKRWSISEMRRSRDAAHGKAPAGETSEVFEARVAPHSADEEGDSSEELAEIRDVQDGDSDDYYDSGETAEAGPDESLGEMTAAPRNSKVRPFENLAELPDDLADAFEQFKLAILHHKLSGWDAVSRDDVVGALESLKALALAPSE